MNNFQPIKPFVQTLFTGVTLLALAAMFARAEAASSSERGPHGSKLEAAGSQAGPPAWTRSGHGGAMRGRIHEWIENFRERRPEKYRELMKLREENPQEFRHRLREHMRELVKEGQAEKGAAAEDDIRALAHDCRQAETDAQRRELRSKLRARLEELFDSRIAEQQERLAEMEARIAEVQRALDRRLEHRDTIIENHLDDVLRPPELRWRTDLP